jgi:hypothetical protein
MRGGWYKTLFLKTLTNTNTNTNEIFKTIIQKYLKKWLSEYKTEYDYLRKKWPNKEKTKNCRLVANLLSDTIAQLSSAISPNIFSDFSNLYTLTEKYEDNDVTPIIVNEAQNNNTDKVASEKRVSSYSRGPTGKTHKDVEQFSKRAKEISEEHNTFKHLITYLTEVIINLFKFTLNDDKYIYPYYRDEAAAIVANTRRKAATYDAYVEGKQYEPANILDNLLDFFFELYKFDDTDKLSVSAHLRDKKKFIDNLFSKPHKLDKIHYERLHECISETYLGGYKMGRLFVQLSSNPV